MAITPSRYAPSICPAPLCDDNFLDFIRRQFVSYAIPPAMICFEVTETSAISNLQQATVSSANCASCHFLDDFGAGMSSFAYLKHLQVDYLKIDGSFVKDMVEDSVDRAMVEMINHIGHVTGKKRLQSLSVRLKSCRHCKKSAWTMPRATIGEPRLSSPRLLASRKCGLSRPE
jgi:predicted signal transduction protein with EAL and GGDEF domain